MRFENATLGASFELPDRPTVRQQLQFFSEAMLSTGREAIERKWMGTRALLTNWQCARFPDPQADLASIDDPGVTDVIIWATLAATNHMNALRAVPKN